MKFGSNQPYLFPYLGFFQLINYVDYFGVSDDHQYIKQGWIVRNSVLENGKSKMFVFSLKKDKHEKLIRDRFFSDNFEYEKAKFLKTINYLYNKAPYFHTVYDLVKNIMMYDSKNVSKFTVNQLKIICEYLDIKTKFLQSESWNNNNNNNNLLKEDKLIHKLQNISEKLPVTRYVNLIGGKEMYEKEYFQKNGFELCFLKMNEIKYNQFESNFVPNLSIIDVLMFNSKEEVKEMLFKFDLE